MKFAVPFLFRKDLRKHGMFDYEEQIYAVEADDATQAIDLAKWSASPMEEEYRAMDGGMVKVEFWIVAAPRPISGELTSGTVIYVRDFESRRVDPWWPTHTWWREGKPYEPLRRGDAGDLRKVYTVPVLFKSVAPLTYREVIYFVEAAGIEDPGELAREYALHDLEPGSANQWRISRIADATEIFWPVEQNGEIYYRFISSKQVGPWWAANKVWQADEQTPA